MDLFMDLRDTQGDRLALEFELQAAEKVIDELNDDRKTAHDALDLQEKENKKDKMIATITIVLSVACALVLGFGTGYAAGAL